MSTVPRTKGIFDSCEFSALTSCISCVPRVPPRYYPSPHNESAGSHQDASVGPGAYISIGNAQRQSHPQPPGIWLQTCNAEDISICTIAQIAFMLPGTLSRWCLYYASLPARCIGSSATQYSCVIMVDLIIICLIGLLETYDFWLTAHTSGGIGETREAHQHVR